MTQNKSQWETLDEIDKAFSDPSFYPHEIKKIDRKETHISLVFLTGRWVYKIKKPVDFGFLNYTTLDLRKHYCHREVELNKRLSDDVYDTVVEICRDPETGKLTLERQCNSPVEYAVRMRELPDNACFRRLIERGEVTSNHIQSIARRLADFYSSGFVLPDKLALYGGIEYVRFNTYENFKQLEPFAQEIGGKSFLQWMKNLTYRFTVLSRNLFDERLRKGFVKDGHGDLRADHIYFYRGVHIIDCIEFNNRFRYGDVAADLAFLFMDLLRLGYPDYAYRIIDEYVRVSGDFQLWFLFDFYTAYRAVVRAKVACLETLSHPSDAEQNCRCFDGARRFMNLGAIHTVAYGIPTAWVFMGPPASGKSRLGKRVAQLGHMLYISSDQLRRQIFPDANRSPFGQGAYAKEARDVVYERIFEDASKAVKSGRSVVIDATFSSSKWRKALLGALLDYPVHVVFVETTADKATLAERLRSREYSSDTGESDARIEHLERFLETYEPPHELRADMHVLVNTTVDDENQSLLKLLSEAIKKRILQARSIKPYGGEDERPTRSIWRIVPKERENIDYRIRWRKGILPVLIIAPHGGFIEPGTSIIAEAIAGEKYWFYAFEGIKPSGNMSLHVSSNLFDEDRFLDISSQVVWTLSVHGYASPEETIFVGGRDAVGCEEISEILRESGFDAVATCPKGIRGTNPRNIVNRNLSSTGVQLEISRGMRNHVIDGNEKGQRFLEALRTAVELTTRRFLSK
ncbi:MAG: poly-gamma-glutamate hydrolase family protein [Thermodesulforhabdaceae bacterium]